MMRWSLSSASEMISSTLSGFVRSTARVNAE